MSNGVSVTAEVHEHAAHVFSDEALEFVADLHREFNPRRLELLDLRSQRVARIPTSFGLDFLPETKQVRDGDWRVAPASAGLIDRRVEITGPTDRKMMINALNSGAKVFMADLEDANSPTWHNVIEGQVNLYDAVRRQIRFEQADGKIYELDADHRDPRCPPARLAPGRAPHPGRWRTSFGVAGRFRPDLFQQCGRAADRAGSVRISTCRSWKATSKPGSGTMSSSGRRTGSAFPQGTIRATVLIETIFAAFEMDEILYELRDHAAGLNAGRWDYIFSLIKTFSHSRESHPAGSRAGHDGRAVHEGLRRPAGQDLPPTRRPCDRRHGGVHPDPQGPGVQRVRLRARSRKTSSARPTPGSMAPGSRIRVWSRPRKPSSTRCSATSRTRRTGSATDVEPTAAALLDIAIPGGVITEAGLRTNISVAIQYIDNWLRGIGAAAINNLMEDAATAEISRAQIWQWIRHSVRTDERRRRSSSSGIARSATKRSPNSDSPEGKSLCRCGRNPRHAD